MRIVCVHQGFDLYGSDRAFLESVAAIRDGWPDADIEVVLPREGTLAAPARRIATRVTVEPLLILRRRDLARLVLLAPFVAVPAVWRAAARMRAADAVYINTLVVLDYLIAARFFRTKTVVHVHEMASGRVGHLLGALLRWTSSTVIFNSRACRNAYQLPEAQPQHVVYNGIASPDAIVPANYDGSRPLRLLMLGRINRIKGQNVLLEALSQLPPALRDRLEVRIVGSSFDNDTAAEEALRRRVAEAGLARVVAFEPFREDTAPLYRWADIVAAPSRLPETLGRVAIEAAAHARPTLASSIGGLPEVVEDGVTGWLVRPDDATDLARALAGILSDHEPWQGYGPAARRRYQSLFDPAIVGRQIRSVVSSLLARSGPLLASPASLGDRGRTGKT